MLNDRIEQRWIAAFEHTFKLCKVEAGELVAILSETQSRELNVHLSELAALRMGAKVFHVVVPTAPQTAPVAVRSTGASTAIQKLTPVIDALKASSMVIDCTVEGLLHAPELEDILKSGSRILMVSNEHPDALERLVPDESIKPLVKAAVSKMKAASRMHVSSQAGTDLTVNLEDTPAIGVWGYTDRPGTIAHWPGGLVLSFPKENTINGTLVLDAGDINLTFKRYLTGTITLTIENDYITQIDGVGADAEMMRRYLKAWQEKDAYAVSHVGFGLNSSARYESLSQYGQRDTNGTEQRAFAGNFLFSTGANEFAGRYTDGHFDIPVTGCTITLDDVIVVENGELIDRMGDE